MTADTVKGFVDLAGVVTGVGVDRAKEAMRTLLTAALDVLDNPGAALANLAEGARSGVAHAEDSVEDAAEGLSELIRSEVDRAAARFGFVREEELAALRARVQRLEAQLASGAGTAASTTETASKPTSRAAKSTTRTRTNTSTKSKKAVKSSD